LALSKVADKISANATIKTKTKANIRPIAVIKVGGDVLLEESERLGLAQNIKDLNEANWDIVILHGGGTQVDRLQRQHGLQPRKIGGRRITSLEDLLVIKQAICGEVNVNLVQILQDAQLNAFGCSGNSGKLITARQRPPRVVSGAGNDAIDFGEVGDVTKINVELITTLLSANLIPVIATLGVESNSGRVFNINADTTVVRLAKALAADLLLLTTSVGAIYKELGNEDTRISIIDKKIAKELIASEVIYAGMIPKIEEALSVEGKVAIVGPQIPGAFLSIAEGRVEFGTTLSTEAT